MLLLSTSTTPAAKAHMEAQMSYITDMSKQIFQSAQKFNELNIQVAQAMMEEAFKNAHQCITAEDPTELISIIASQAQPAAEKVRSYRQHLKNIVVGTQVDLAKTAEEHIPETSRTAGAFAEEVAKSASEETEKLSQRQKAAMEKLTTPLEKSTDASKHSRSAH